jgi:hypothetical protein
LPEEPQSPFESIEDTQEFLELLQEVIRETAAGVLERVEDPQSAANRQRLEALQTMHYKLTRIESHVDACIRLIADLRTLRKMLDGGPAEETS